MIKTTLQQCEEMVYKYCCGDVTRRECFIYCMRRGYEVCLHDKPCGCKFMAWPNALADNEFYAQDIIDGKLQIIEV